MSPLYRRLTNETINKGKTLKKIIVLPFLITTSLLVMTLFGGEVGPFVDLSFDNALELAVKGDKIVMVKFRADWCPLCRKMDKETFTDPHVQETLRLFIPIQVDVDDRQGFNLAQRVGVSALPTIVFFDSRGNVIGKYQGYRGPGEMRDILARHGKSETMRE